MACTADDIKTLFLDEEESETRTNWTIRSSIDSPSNDTTCSEFGECPVEKVSRQVELSHMSDVPACRPPTRSHHHEMSPRTKAVATPLGMTIIDFDTVRCAAFGFLGLQMCFWWSFGRFQSKLVCCGRLQANAANPKA